MPQPACIQHWRLEKHFLCDGQLDKRADLSRRVLDTNGPSACLQVQHATSHGSGRPLCDSFWLVFTHS